MLLWHTSRTRTTAPVGRLLGRHSARYVAAMALVLVAGAACSDDDDGPAAPAARADITLSDTSITLLRGETATVAASLTGGSGGITWTAYRPDIATISADGTITAVADGSTFFTATSDADATVNRSVVVRVVSTIVSIAPSANFSWLGGPTRTLTATVENNANTAVTWSSSNTAVATVSAAGVVTPVAAGTANITAKSVGDPTKESVASFTVDPAVLTATAGGDPIQALTSGTGVGGLAAASGTFKYFRIAVPAGATNLRVALSGASSDIDLFVVAAAVPTQNYAANALPTRCGAFTASGNEVCTIPNPQSRVYYVMVDAYEAYSDVTLTATVTGG